MHTLVKGRKYDRIVFFRVLQQLPKELVDGFWLIYHEQRRKGIHYNYDVIVGTVFEELF